MLDNFQTIRDILTSVRTQEENQIKQCSLCLTLPDMASNRTSIKDA